jgi:hypothetical protein
MFSPGRVSNPYEARLMYLLWLNNLVAGDHVACTVSLQDIEVDPELRCYVDGAVQLRRTVVYYDYGHHDWCSQKTVGDELLIEAFGCLQYHVVRLGLGYEAGTGPFVGYHPEPLFRIHPLCTTLHYHPDVGYYALRLDECVQLYGLAATS